MATRTHQRRNETVVAIQDHVGGDIHKVMKLVAGRDGSVSIMCPYHPARTGDLVKIGAPPILTRPAEGWTKPVESYRVNQLVKLTYYASGFCHFSAAGEGRIRSGRRDAEGFYIAKGIGLNSHPITDPIDTGPVMGA